MKKIIVNVAICCVLTNIAQAQIIRRSEPLASRTAAQVSVGQYRPMVKNIDYMLEHYTDGELRNYAKSLNQQEIEDAKKNNQPVPEKLDEDVLKSRKKIGEYLRSYINVPYQSAK